MEPAVEPGSGGPQASRQARDGPKSRGRRGWRKGKVKASAFSHNMDLRTMTQSLVTLAEDNMAFFSSQGPGETARRLSNVFAGVREQAVGLEPTLGHLLGVAHKFDLYLFTISFR